MTKKVKNREKGTLSGEIKEWAEKNPEELERIFKPIREWAIENKESLLRGMDALRRAETEAEEIRKFMTNGDLSDFVTMKPISGLAFLTLYDEDAQRGRAFSKGGSSKKGRYYEPKASIKIICDKIKSFELNDVLDFLRDGDNCADLYESTNNPIGVSFCGVDDEASRISFYKRGDNPDQQKSITFKRLTSILNDLKK